MDLVDKFKKGIGDSSIFQFFKDKERFLWELRGRS